MGTALIISMVMLLVHEAVSPQTVLLLGAYSAGYWLAFALNDFYDVPVDALDPAKRERNYFVGRQVGWWGITAAIGCGNSKFKHN